MYTIHPGEIKTSLFHSYMLAAIAPRPIAFASTIDRNGVPNLAPFSFFNAFGSNPPIVVFSPARRVRDNTIKHTLENILEIPEVVINSVSYAMVQQTSLASTEYPKGVNEFTKAGFTMLKSDLIRPFRVAEAPVQMECKVVEVKETGRSGGAANLIVCEILRMHIAESVLTTDNRMGEDYYCRASGAAIFRVGKPLLSIGIGVDQLPERIRLSKILTGNNLGQLGNVDHLPLQEEVDEVRRKDFMKDLYGKFGRNPEILEEKIHELAKTILEKGLVEDAWKILLSMPQT